MQPQIRRGEPRTEPLSETWVHALVNPHFRGPGFRALKRAEVRLEDIAERQLICTSLDVQGQKCRTYWFDMIT